METKVIKSLIVLGVPGVALGMFYLLLKGFNFKFEVIPPVLSAAIAIVFLLVVGCVTLFALHKWAPLKTIVVTDTRDHNAIVRIIGEWTRIIYDVKTEWQRAMVNNTPYPGEHQDLVERENALFTEILGTLDSSRPSEERLISDLKAFRESDDLSTWMDRRDVLMLSIRAALKQT